ncbi:ATP-grasp domain-containing protein [Streptomyces sp. NPDC050147]|uniref:ATP-grasp domain-containing protein n=1 Tax=Streptomyces sp. NPDC050147 TaxID=3155513 RepID=UPI00343CA94B
MGHLVFVESSVTGQQALEYAVERGHTVTLLCSSRVRYDNATRAESERARSLAHRVVEIDDLRDTAAALGAVRSAAAAGGAVDGVLSTIHELALPAARLARLTGARGTSVEAVSVARDKAACRRTLDAHGLPNVAHALAATAGEALAAAASIGYPVIVKPVRGVAKAVTTLARTPHDVETHFAHAAARHAAVAPCLARELDGRFLVEEVAVGPLYSVEVAADGTTCTALAAVRRKTGADNPLLELGSTIPCGLPAPAERELMDYAVRVCRAIGMDLGLFHVEVIGTAAGCRLVEVNPRIAGGAVPDLIRAATGRSLFHVLIDLYDGARVPREPFRVRTAASHTFLTAAEDCRVRDDLPENWLESFRHRLHSGHTSIAPGTRLRGMNGNGATYGVVRLTAETASRAEAASAALHADIERLLGIRMPAVAPGLAEEG